MAEIIRAKAMNEYDSYEEFDADFSRYRRELMEHGELNEQELGDMSPEAVPEHLARLGHAIVDAEDAA